MTGRYQHPWLHQRCAAKIFTHFGKTTGCTTRMNTPSYGAKVQYSPDDNNSRALEIKQKTVVQKIVGSLFYYTLAIDTTMLVALGNIASEKSKIHLQHSQGR